MCTARVRHARGAAEMRRFRRAVGIQVPGYLGIRQPSRSRRGRNLTRPGAARFDLALIVDTPLGRAAPTQARRRPQITKDELAKALTSLEMDASEEAVMQMMQRIDKDSSGTITLDEFSSIVAWQLQLLASGLGSRKSLVAES